MAATTGALPRKAHGLMTTDLGTEVVVVDSSTDQAHALTGLSAEIWRSLDEGRLPAVPQAELATAIKEMTDLGLIELNGVSRRVLLQRAGAVAVAGGVITIGLPQVAMASSVKKNSTTSLAATPGSGQATLTATVNSGVALDTGQPTGNVDFYDATSSPAVLLGSAALGTPAANTAQFTATGLPAGSRSFYAVYAGDAAYNGSTSSTIQSVVAAPKPTPTIAFAPNTKQNSSASSVVTLTGTAGKLFLAGTSGTVRLTINTPNSVTITSTNPATEVPTTGSNPPKATGTFQTTNPKLTANGSMTISYTIDYSGDTNYGPASLTSTYVVS